MTWPCCRPEGLHSEADLSAAADELSSATVQAKPVVSRSLAHRTRAVILTPWRPRRADRGDPGNRGLPRVGRRLPGAGACPARLRRPCRALSDVETGLGLAPGDPRLLDMRGLLKLDVGNPAGSLIDLDRALIREHRARSGRHRAMALAALGNHEAAVQEWGLAADQDPEDPRVYLGRARAEIGLKPG